MNENERYLYHQGKWAFLLNDDDHTAWIKRGHIGRGKHYRVPSFVMVHGVRYTITSIEIAAYNCPNTLHHLVIPDSVTYIDEDCFKLFKNLRSVHIGKGVEHLPNWNFYSPKLSIFTIDKGNPHLKMVDGMVLSQDGTAVEREIFPKRIRIIPEGVTYIAPLAFWYDDKMESVQLPSTIQVIGVDSFLGCSNAVTQLIDIPNNQPDEFYNFGGISK